MFQRRLSIGLAVVVLALISITSGAKDKARVLVYSGSTGYRHASIPAAVTAIKALGEKAGYLIDTSEDPEVFSPGNLAKYKALVLVYSGSTGYRHASIPAAVTAIKALGEKAGYLID